MDVEAMGKVEQVEHVTVLMAPYPIKCIHFFFKRVIIACFLYVITSSLFYALPEEIISLSSNSYSKHKRTIKWANNVVIEYDCVLFLCMSTSKDHAFEAQVFGGQV